MYTAIIIDDESKLRKVLAIKIEQHCPSIEVVSHAEDANDAFEKITKYKPNLIFLDIAMPGESGFELLNRFEEIDFEIIFVTGYNEYALDALKVSAVDYILKPVKTQSLIDAVDKAKVLIDRKQIEEKYNILKHNLANIGNQESKVAIPGSSAYDFVKVGSIVRCEGWQKYSKIFLSNGAVLISSYSLGVFKDMLESYDFFSTHKSHIVNKHHITRYKKEGLVQLSDGSEVPVARRRKEEFVEKIINQLDL